LIVKKIPNFTAEVNLKLKIKNDWLNEMCRTRKRWGGWKIIDSLKFSFSFSFSFSCDKVFFYLFLSILRPVPSFLVAKLFSTIFLFFLSVFVFYISMRLLVSFLSVLSINCSIPVFLTILIQSLYFVCCFYSLVSLFSFCPFFSET
jgi:hypothetical protein